MCKYCEPDNAGNLANIEEDGNYLLTWVKCTKTQVSGIIRLFR